jgi:putative ABC transport system permease protein
MFINYIKIAFRNLVKHRGYTIINVVGLSIGIACFILISLYVLDEVSYDKYHEKADRTYRVINIIDFEGVSERSTSSPFPLGPTIGLEYPEWIESVTRVYNEWSSTFYNLQRRKRIQ